MPGPAPEIGFEKPAGGCLGMIGENVQRDKELRDE
jgi:hypothetical protein